MIHIRNDIFLKALAKHLVELRKEKGLSQEQLAHKAQIPVNQVGRIERGEINPTVSTIYALAIALETSPSQVLNFEI